MEATIHDVAQKAGVSTTTVSFVFNNRKGVSEKTRKIVLDAAKSLGYKSNVSNNSGKKNGSICFLKIASHGHIVNPDHNVFIADYIDGIEKEARKSGFSLEILNYPVFDINAITKDLKNSRFNGVIILATELSYNEISLFTPIQTPKVFMDVTYPFCPFDFVNMDNESAVYTVVKTFLDHGHTNIGLIKSSAVTQNFKLREKYFFEALSYFGLASKKEWCFSVDSTFENSYHEMSQVLKKSPSLPTAFFCVCDIIALGCCKAFREKGLKIPQNISVIGFDDLPSCQMTEPSLSSVKVSKKDMGKTAFQILHRKLLKSDNIHNEKVFISCDLVLRDSLQSRK
ncbi:LacI family DNA-binding transcriptional regulator [Breznakiella homolactica]|uniref:LacI family DNA-binding transcriptional regulator n=1 Tax=Breznakiella homolactica TaxID=2798577 RepID=A0A7T8BAC3_9SPIR|nr:LacI family DNA-binding transcriptional regulator [Breznakiella homolactica]QQO09377.1 LacI family transcriptional regulator [Breznakiella homolactica]